jgi:type II secretory pathway pseudopilin PulG
VFADTHGLLDVFKNIFPPALNESFSTLDFQSLQAVGYASCLEKSGITRDISYAYTAGKREGFLAALTPASPVDATIYFPQDSAILFATGNLNMGAWWSNAIKSAEMFSDSQGEGSKKPLEELKSFEEKLGFSIEKDLLPSIGEHFSYYVGLPEGGGAFPEAAVLLEVKDKEKLTKCVELLLAKLGEKVRKTEFEGNTLYYVVLSDLIKSAKKRETPIPYLPALIITDKHLVVGTMPQTVKRIVEGLAQPASPTGSLKDALASLPKGASSFSYIDLAKAGGYLYNTLTLFLRDLPEGAPKIDFGALPESKTITKHLGTISGYEVADKEGIRNEITSSCGPFIIPLCFASITAAVAIPNLLESRKSASQTAAAGMLRVIATTVETFRVKYGDYPASEISPRDTEGDARLLFEAQDDCPGLEGVQDCPTINPDLAKAYTFTYTRISAEKWTCTADTNRKDSHDFFIDQSGVLRAAPSTGDGCQANENSNPSGGLEPIPVPEPIPVIPGDR